LRYSDETKAEFMAKYGRMTLVYHRDRGEPWDHVKPKDYASVEALVEVLRGDGSWIEWLYLFRDGRWYVWDTVPRHEGVQEARLTEYLAAVVK
jgi:hypothetical protein